jgi:hypothetical protein
VICALTATLDAAQSRLVLSSETMKDAGVLIDRRQAEGCITASNPEALQAITAVVAGLTPQATADGRRSVRGAAPGPLFLM